MTLTNHESRVISEWQEGSPGTPATLQLLGAAEVYECRLTWDDLTAALALSRLTGIPIERVCYETARAGADMIVTNRGQTHALNLKSAVVANDRLETEPR